MAEQPPLPHRKQHRALRISLPSKPAITTSRPYPPLPSYPPTTPTPTPSKHRISSLSTSRPTAGKTTSLSTLFLLLFSLRSLYSLLPFLRASPSSFSIFPFSFLVSLLSFILTLSFSLFSFTSPFSKKQTHPVFSPTSLTQSQHRHLLAKSLVLATVFLLRFQALRYCGTAAMILAEFSGTVAARFLFDGQNRNVINPDRNKVRGFLALSLGLLFLSLSWDRVECFPFSFVNLDKFGISFLPSGNCVRVWPLLLPFLSGFLGCYERVAMNSVNVRELGQKRVRLISLFYTSVVLFVPAIVSMLVFEAEGDSVSIGNLGWPLANTVVFGVLLSENYTDDYKVVANLKDYRREFLITFSCTLILELFYYPELSLWGLLLCGLLFGIAVRELNPFHSKYVELGSEPSESLTTSIMKPIRHILNERKSRKIALFLLINTGYMVVEFTVGFMSNSLGLISDACHMLFDCAALSIGLYASYISRLPANGQYNYGRGRFEVLSGYVNAVFLVLVGALIVLESLERILEPQEISTSSLLTVSMGGLLVNVVGLIFFHDEHHHAHGGSCSHSDAHGHTHMHSHHSNHSHEHAGHCSGVHSKHQTNHEHQNDQCTGAQCIDHDHHSHKHNHHHHGDHHDHGKQHDHHRHGEHHDHRDHNHDHDHDHGKQHDYHHHNHDHKPQNDHHDGHSDGTILVTASGEGPEKHPDRHIDHNMEGIFLHVLADTLGSVGVVISTLLIRYKGWLVADPAASIFISVLIVSSVLPLLRNSAEILLQRVPKSQEQELKEAVKSIMKIKGVSSIQKLHVWRFTSTDVIGTINLRVSSETDKGSTKAQVLDILHDVGIKDLTIQIDGVQNS